MSLITYYVVPYMRQVLFPHYRDECSHSGNKNCIEGSGLVANMTYPLELKAGLSLFAKQSTTTKRKMITKYDNTFC